MGNISIKEKVLNSIKPIIANSKLVSVDFGKISALAKKLKNYPLPGWDNVSQFSGNPEETIQYYFFLDSINFCFWNKKDKARWEFKKGGQWIHGYYAYSYAIKKAFLKDKRLLDAFYLSNISFPEFSKIFQSRGELLLLKERHKIIQENFKILQNKYQGKAINLIRAAKNDVNALVNLIIRDFPNFRDWTELKKHRVYFLKRAQLFVSDIYYALRGKGFGYFKNMEDLTIFADYKLPQLLESEGVLIYDKKLRNKIKTQELIKKSSLEEIEIRANTIYSCEMILKELNGMGKKLTSNNLDWMLWVLSKKTKSSLSYHKTITISY